MKLKQVAIESVDMTHNPRDPKGLVKMKIVLHCTAASAREFMDSMKNVNKEKRFENLH